MTYETFNDRIHIHINRNEGNDMDERRWHYSWGGLVFRTTDEEGEYEVRDEFRLDSEGTTEDLIAEVHRLSDGLSETEYVVESESDYDGYNWAVFTVRGVRPAREDELSQIASALNEEERQNSHEATLRRAQYEKLKEEFGD